VTSSSRIPLVLLVCVALLATLIAVSACGSAEAQDPSLLSANPWTVTRFDDGNGNLRPVDLPQAERAFGLTLEFPTSKRLAGFSGLNNFSAPYEAQEDGSMTIGVLAATKMAGSPELMNQEQAFFDTLARVAAYRLEAGGLTLLDETGEPLVRARPQQNAALETTTWKCVAYNNGSEAIVSVLTGTEITATLQDGRVSGSSGVNTYSASYTLDGHRLVIEMPATTSAETGSAEAMAQEQAYLAALADVSGYRIERDELVLLGAGGMKLAEYVAEP
jgi:heat shock protein HslJ